MADLDSSSGVKRKRETPAAAASTPGAAAFATSQKWGHLITPARLAGENELKARKYRKLYEASNPYGISDQLEPHYTSAFQSSITDHFSDLTLDEIILIQVDSEIEWRLRLLNTFSGLGNLYTYLSSPVLSAGYPRKDHLDTHLVLGYQLRRIRLQPKVWDALIDFVTISAAKALANAKSGVVRAQFVKQSKDNFFKLIQEEFKDDLDPNWLNATHMDIHPAAAADSSAYSASAAAAGPMTSNTATAASASAATSHTSLLSRLIKNRLYLLAERVNHISLADTAVELRSILAEVEENIPVATAPHVGKKVRL